MNRTEVERLAGMANKLRPDWAWGSLCTFIEANLKDRAYRDVAVALAYVACEAETKTPKRVLEPGPWWRATVATSAIAPVIVTHCEHKLPGRTCAECYPRTSAPRALPTPEQREAIRAAVEAGRAELARIERLNEGRP